MLGNAVHIGTEWVTVIGGLVMALGALVMGLNTLIRHSKLLANNIWQLKEYGFKTQVQRCDCAKHDDDFEDSSQWQ